MVIALLSGTPAQDLDTRLYRGEWEQVLGGLGNSSPRPTPEPTRRGSLGPGAAARAQVTKLLPPERRELADQVSAQALEAAEKNNHQAPRRCPAQPGQGVLLARLSGQAVERGPGLLRPLPKLYAQATDARGEAEAWFYLGLVEQQQDHLDAGDERFRKGLALAESVKDEVLQSFFHRHLAASAEDRGQLDQAEKGFVESARLRLEGKACVLSPFAQITLADFYEKANRSREKIPGLLEEAVATATRCGSNPAAIQAHLRLARAAQSPVDRRKHAEQALALPSASTMKRWSRRPQGCCEHRVDPYFPSRAPVVVGS
jgi:tetratricopeptide (TPR) repeat protein